MPSLNIINRFFLRLALAPGRLYSNWGVSVPQLRSILTYKLIMDDRRPNPIQQSRFYKNREKKDSRNSYIGSLILSVLFGSIFLYVFSVGKDLITQFTLYFSMYLVYLCLNLITDFTSVLIDIRDNYIILPKPVNDKTLLISRLLHIFIHLCKTILPISLPGFFFLGIQRSWPEAITFFFLIILATLFCIFLINSVYILILKLTTPEKFKNIISYIQIAFTILIYAAYNLLPRIMRRPEMLDYHLDFSPFWLFAPPYWFACAASLPAGWHQANPWIFLSSALSLIIPVISIYFVIKYLAPSFNQKLSMISGSDGEQVKPIMANFQKKEQIEERLSTLLTNTQLERSGFLFSWKMMARSRDFKIKVYPMIGYVVVIIVLILFTNNQGELSMKDNRHLNSKGSIQVLIALYASGILILAAMRQMAFSDKFKASWIFYSSPFRTPGEWISGSMKALLIQFYIAYCLTFLLFAYFVYGAWILPNIILGLINLLTVLYIMILVRAKELPFTKTLMDMQKRGQVMRNLLMTAIFFVAGGLQFLVYKYPIAVLIFGFISLGILTGLMIQLKKTNWNEMESVSKDF